MPQIDDPEALTLAGISATIEADYVGVSMDPWAGSPFGWILAQPSRRKGAIGEQLVSRWCVAEGFVVSRSPDSEADRIIEGHRIEVKLSTLWAGGGYKFQQIRNQRYEYLFCLGIAPFAVNAWLIPKAVLLEHVIGHTGQHTGAGGKDTAWLGFPAHAPYAWLAPYGGRLADVRSLLRENGRGPHAR